MQNALIVAAVAGVGLVVYWWLRARGKHADETSEPVVTEALGLRITHPGRWKAEIVHDKSSDAPSGIRFRGMDRVSTVLAILAEPLQEGADGDGSCAKLMTQARDSVSKNGRVIAARSYSSDQLRGRLLDYSVQVKGFEMRNLLFIFAGQQSLYRLILAGQDSSVQGLLASVMSMIDTIELCSPSGQTFCT